MVEVFNRIDVNYSLKDFDSDKKEKEAVKSAKREAVKARYSFNEITEIGSGSGERTTIYKADNEAIKVICCQTKKCFGENLEEEKKKLCRKVELDSDCREGIMNEIQCWMKLKSTDNIIPMYGFEIFSWTCPEYDRVGVDCAVKMVLAECITDTIDKYILRKQKSLKTEKTEDQDLIIQIGIDICTALTAIHRNKLVHRDIKPDNIFWFDDKFCLGDFGIALDQNNPQYLYGKAEKEWKKGTPVYWSPQQADGDIVDHRTDIYSLGLVLYELADTAPMSSHYDDRIQNHMLPELGSDISEGLKGILHNACAYSPDHRYQTAEEFKNDLCRLKNDPTYIPESTESKFKQKMKQIETSHISEMGFRSNKEISKNSRFRKLGINNQRNVEKYLCPETAWNAGKFWYDESCKPGSRFAGLDIDKRIMPLTSPKPHVTDFPVNITTDPECNSEPTPLSEIIEHPENLHNMYLIGEGGIGKTTALHSIMKDTYKNKVFVSRSNETFIIPLFIELSKAPASYCTTYKNKQSTFIQRYLFALISSLAENHLIFESSYEMTAIMEMEADSIIKNIRHLLNSDNPNVKYLLLLDGLNEVSRRQLTDNKNNYIGTPVELIVDEIQELLKYQNISIVITSRADETLDALDDQFDRSYLTGVSEPVIEEYLKNKIDFKAIKENKRLMDTLKIPLFLKFYSQLYSTSEVSTPGEILYAFFSEHSTKYSMHNRIAEIVKDRRSSGNTHAVCISDQRMQWFILDFLLPELGWYMEKNNLYTVDQTVIQEIGDTILKGTSETDICGKYGITMFGDYRNRNDANTNVKTYADQLLALNSINKNYVQEIVNFCIYSLGILYVNNQNYGFVHQHIRDFFASVKIITDMKIASYIFNVENNAELGRRWLTSLTNELLSEEIIHFIGEIACEYQNIPIYTEGHWKSREISAENITIGKNNRVLITNTLELFRYYFPDERDINYGVWNLLKIMYTARKTLAAVNLKDLDLRNCSFNNIELYDADLSGCLINQESLFTYGHDDVITKAIVSKSGKYIFTCGYDGKLKLWHLNTAKCIKNIKEYNSPIYNISISQNYIAVSTAKYVEILDINTYKVIKKYSAYFGLFSPNGEYLLLFFRMQKARLVYINNKSNFDIIKKLNYPIKSNSHYGILQFNNITFSPDSKYIVFKSKHFAQNCLELWNTEKCQFVSKIYTHSDDAISIVTFSPDGKYLIISDTLCHFKIFSFNSYHGETTLIHEIWVKRILDNYISTITCIQFVLKGQYLVLGDSYGKNYLCSFKSLFNSEKGISTDCWILDGHSSAISSICEYSCNNIPYIITSSYDCKIKIWNLQSKKCTSLLHKGNSSSTLSACYILDGKYIVVSGNSRELLVFNPTTGEYVGRIGNTNDYTWKYTWKLAYHSATKQLAVALDNGSIALFQYVETTFVHKKTIRLLKEYIRDIKFSPDGHKILVFSWLGNEFAIYDIYCNRIVSFSKEHAFRGTGSFSFPKGKGILASLNYSDSIGYFDSETGAFKRIGHAYFRPYQNNLFFRIFEKFTNIPYEEQPVWETTAIKYSDNGKHLFIARYGGAVEIWNISEETSEERCMAILRSFCSQTNQLAVSSDGSLIAFSTDGPNLKVYRMQDIQKNAFGKIKNWKCKYDIRGMWRFQFKKNLNKIYRCIYKTKNGHTDFIVDMEFSPDQKQLLTTACDHTIKIWNLDDSNFPNKYHVTPPCLRTIEFIPGLKVKGAVFKNLHSQSNLTPKQQLLLETYGAIFH